MNAVEVAGLCKSFHRGKKKVVAVDDISFSIKKGEIYGLLGVNGAGKSTTINILAGLLKKDAGTIKILGKDPLQDWEYVKNRMNTSTAYYPLSDVLSITQNLNVYAKIYQVNNYQKKIKELLSQFELSHLANRKVSQLSSGERTRTALCKGLINDPEVLFLDECTVGLDPDIAEKTRTLIKDYHQRTGSTILLTSHYMYEVEELCKRIAFMQQGKIIKIDTASKLKSLITHLTIQLTVKKKAAQLKKFLKQEGVDLLQAKNNTFVFETTRKQDQMYKILNKIFAKGFLLDELHINQPTLDDIFIKFARKK